MRAGLVGKEGGKSGKAEREGGRAGQGKRQERVRSLAWLVLQHGRASGVLLGAQGAVRAAVDDIAVFMQIRVAELRQM